MESKEALDKVIKKSRAHFYKPIQIAEILFRNRNGMVDVTSVENYRAPSRRWRDEISLRLVGSVSTSSSRYQDNLFDNNAIPNSVMVSLAAVNRRHAGIVEAYIYKSMASKMNDLGYIHKYIVESGVDGFELSKLLELFTNTPGLRRSMDKVYEIVAFALLDTVISALNVNVTLSIDTKDANVLRDFNGFTEKVFNMKESEASISEPARVYRVGSTNANDGGLDLWANFGPAIQVKHFAISAEHLKSITTAVKADRFIIICTDTEKDVISSILTQAGDSSRIQSIITLDDLKGWYELALSVSYKSTIGRDLIARLLDEFEYEFPSNTEIPSFLSERGYDLIEMSGDWEILREELEDG